MEDSSFIKLLAEIRLRGEAPYRYSRKERLKAKSERQNDAGLIILEGPDKYWLYDEDALKIAEILDITLYKTKKGYTLVYEKELHDDILESLNEQGISIIAVHPTEYTYYTVDDALDSPRQAISEDMVFELEDACGEVGKYIIKSRKMEELFEVHYADGTSTIMRKPIVSESNEDGVTVLSKRAPLASLLLGKHLGDVVEYNGVTYRILGIMGSETTISLA